MGCRGGSAGPAAPGATTVSTVSEIEAQLAARRALNIQRLRDYRVAGVYPRNRVVDAQANVFVDENGHHCAVANLMRLDGETDLIEQTFQSNNRVVLASVTQGPLYDWILGSGFTQDEIARIQEPYMPFDPEPNFEVNEDQRLNDHFVEVEQELLTQNPAALLAAARAQRDEILRRNGVSADQAP
jgi:hypothetical protein